MASWSTGLLMAFGTEWVAFRNRWVLISFELTTVAVLIRLSEARTIAAYAGIAPSPSSTADTSRS